MRTVILDSTAAGGQAGTSSRIENYLGFPSGISGAELAERAVLQARKFGATFAVPARATAITRDDRNYTIGLGDGTSVTAGSVVIATGASYRRLDVPRLEFFEQMSVYYAASQAEALLCRGDPVAIVGGGNSAGQATVFLSGHAARVTLIVREPDLSDCMSRYLIDQVERLGNVRVLLRTEVRELLGDQALEAVAVENNRTGARSIVEARALFVFIGAAPCTGWLGGLVDLDDHGFVRTGETARPADAADGRDTGWQRTVLETSQPGIFAVGDVRSGSAKRVAAAVGEGAIAIRLAFERARATHRPAPGGEAGMPVMGFVKFEQFFRAAGGVSVDRDDSSVTSTSSTTRCTTCCSWATPPQRRTPGTSSSPGTCPSWGL